MPASLPTPAAPAQDARRGVLAIPAFFSADNNLAKVEMGYRATQQLLYSISHQI